MKTIRVCDNCEQPRHARSHCYTTGGGKEHEAPDWYLEKVQKKNPKFESANTIRHEAYITTIPNIAMANDSSWIVDSGATTHMAQDHSMFMTFPSLLNNPVNINSASVTSDLQAVGCGTIKFDTHLDGKMTTITLNDILYCPDLSANLLSLQKSIQTSTCLNFTNSACNFSHDSIIFVKAYNKNNLYLLPPTVPATLK